MEVTGILLADGPLAFREVAGRPLFAFALRTLLAAAEVARCVVACAPGREEVAREIVDNLRRETAAFGKQVAVATGGTRPASLAAAVRAATGFGTREMCAAEGTRVAEKARVADGTCPAGERQATGVLLVADATFPCQSAAEITAALAALQKAAASVATCAVPPEESVLLESAGRQEMLPPEGIFLAQSPEALTLGTAQELLRAAETQNIAGATFAELAARLGKDVRFASGRQENRRVADEAGLRMLAAFWESKGAGR